MNKDIRHIKRYTIILAQLRVQTGSKESIRDSGFTKHRGIESYAKPDIKTKSQNHAEAEEKRRKRIIKSHRPRDQGTKA